MWQSAMSTTLTANAAAPLAALQPLVFGDVAMCSSAARKYAPLAASCACISAALALCMPSFRSGYFTKSADSAAAAAYPDVLCTAFLTLIFSVALWRSSYTFIARLLRGFVAASMRLQENIGIAAELFQLGDERGVYQALCADAPFFALEALLAGSMSLQGLPVSLLTAYAGCLAAAVAALALERRLDRKLVGGMLLYPVFMACFLPLQTLALFKTQTIWHEIRHSGVRLAAEVDLRRGEIA